MGITVLGKKHEFISIATIRLSRSRRYKGYLWRGEDSNSEPLGSIPDTVTLLLLHRNISLDPVGKIAGKKQSVGVHFWQHGTVTWHCILSAELTKTHSITLGVTILLHNKPF